MQSTVDRNEMGLGDTFTLTVSVVSNDDVDVQDPRVPELDGLIFSTAGNRQPSLKS